ncbi:MAG: SDR family oxidoreductase [Rickettsiaceae bacterium]|nr:SDR family oxidoreductase [Rickettsiaceae bacterium]
MIDLYIVYGSQTALLEPLYSRHAYFIKIYNTDVPEKNKNSFDINIGELVNLNKLIKVALKKHNSINRVVFVGAGFYSENNIFVNLSEIEIQKSINTNILNYIYIIQTILKSVPIYMPKVSIYMSSFRSDQVVIGASLYCASKAYGETLFDALGKEYARFNHRTCVIKMGYFEGRMMNSLKDSGKISESISQKRFGTADELVSTIEYIISNNYLNSGVIKIDGGIL